MPPSSKNRPMAFRSCSEYAEAEPDSSLPRNGKATKSQGTPVPARKQGVAESTSPGQTCVLGTLLKSQLDQPASDPASGPAPSTRTCAGGTAWLSSLRSCVPRTIPRPTRRVRMLLLVLPVEPASISSTSIKFGHHSNDARKGGCKPLGCDRTHRGRTIGW